MELKGFSDAKGIVECFDVVEDVINFKAIVVDSDEGISE